MLKNLVKDLKPSSTLLINETSRRLEASNLREVSFISKVEDGFKSLTKFLSIFIL